MRTCVHLTRERIRKFDHFRSFCCSVTKLCVWSGDSETKCKSVTMKGKSLRSFQDKLPLTSKVGCRQSKAPTIHRSSASKCRTQVRWQQIARSRDDSSFASRPIFPWLNDLRSSHSGRHVRALGRREILSGRRNIWHRTLELCRSEWHDILHLLLVLLVNQALNRNLLYEMLV